MSFVTPASTVAGLARRSPVHAAMPYDAQVACVTTASIAPESDEVDYQISILDLATGAEESVGPGYGASWSPWGRRLAWAGADDTGAEGIVVREADGSTVVLAGTDGVSQPPAWSPDGAHIAFTAPAREPIDKSQPYRWNRPYPAYDGLGALEAPPQVWIAGAFGAAPVQLTSDQWRWTVLGWSPEAATVAALSGTDPYARSGGQQLHLLGLDGSRTTPALPAGRNIAAEWLTETRLAVLIFEPADRPAGSDPVLFIVDGAHSDGHEQVTRLEVPGLGGDVYGDQPAELVDLMDHLIVAVDEDQFFLRTVERGAMGIALATITAADTGAAWQLALEPVLGGPRSCTPIYFSNGRLLFATVAPDHPVEVAVLEWPERHERTVTAFGAREAIEIDRFQVETDAVAPVDAWCLRPAGAERPLPAVLIVHGGPHYAYGESYSLDAVALIQAGFAVLYANPRGSTGTSSAFAAQSHGDWAHGPSGDLVAVIDEAADRGWIDPGAVGVAGNSYGGYMAAWMAATTDRFVAAVAENPVTDLASMYYTSDLGTWFFPAQLGGTPTELPALYADQSPLTYARDTVTPILFVSGDQDRRCPAQQSWAMHRQVLAGGGHSEVLVLPGATHEGSTYGPPACRRAHDAALVEWMTRHLI